LYVLTDVIQVVTLTTVGEVVLALVSYCRSASLVEAACVCACVRVRRKLTWTCEIECWDAGPGV